MTTGNTAGGACTLSVVVPVYNSAESLQELVGRLIAQFDKLGAEYEIILVNDASRDGSWDGIRRLASEHACISGLSLMRNFGQHNALLCGIRAAKNDIIITIDDDLQNPPEEIPLLLNALDGSRDVIYGTPEREQHGFLRDLASRITKIALQGAMGAATARQVSAFRAFRASLRDAFADYRGPFVSIDVLLTWATTRFDAVVVKHDRRRQGVSHYSVGKLIRHAINMATGFSTLPLQFASLVGFAFTLFGLAVLTYVLVRYIAHGGSVPGFPFLASIIAIFSGAQLFALGIIGEYLARMHFSIMDRPAYVVRETLTSNP